MATKRTWLGPSIYVEHDEGAEGMVVSWPLGHKRVSSSETFLLTLSDAIEDTYHPQPIVRPRLVR